MAAWAKGEIEGALNHHSEHVMRIEVHLSDDNGAKSGPTDKRCVLEARLNGRQPLAVTHHGESLHQAVTGAAEKMNRMIETSLGRSARSQGQPG